MASGFNVVDFMDLPPVERCIVRLVLRESMMTYLELVDAVATLPADHQMDRQTFDSALNHLTFNDWLLSQRHGPQTVYRVNTLQKTPTQRQGLLDNLDLEPFETPELRLTLENTDQVAPTNRGKRVLPAHIWDCLTGSNTKEPVNEPPERRASLFDMFIDDDSGSTKR